MDDPLLNKRYQLSERLGQGGMGVVYKALDRLTGQYVALKRVHMGADQLIFNSRDGSTEAPLALAREFQTLASLRHPNIIEVLDYGFDQHQPFYTMSLLENAYSFYNAAIKRDVVGKIDLIIQILHALAYLHRYGIVHRDLKPGNVMVDKSEQVRVLDFGLAIEHDQTKEIVGTISYMAPEILREEGATAASDLYAVGVMLYELFAECHPFMSLKLSDLMRDIVNRQPDLTPIMPLSKTLHAANGGPQLHEIIACLLSKSPQDRYVDADTVIQDLHAAIGQPLPEEQSEIRESYLQAARFIGREAEQQQLIGALDTAQQGKGAMWLIGGESGIGKSRLMDELSTHAKIRGMLVLRGQTAQTGKLAYHTWRDVIRRLAISVEVTDAEAAALRTLIPDIETLLDRKIDHQQVTGQVAQQVMLQTIVNLFHRQKQPMLLLLEDLQWAHESMEPLKMLYLMIEHLPLLIVGNYRSDERPDLPAMFPGVQNLELTRLNKQEVTRLSRSMLGHVDQALVDMLNRETEGNVLFLIEVLRSLASEAGSLQNIQQMRLPRSILTGGVQAVVERRLQRVPAWMLSHLKLAAIMGRRLDMPVWEQTSDNLLSWLMICANASVLEIHEGVWQFAHDKIRETILRSIPAQEKIAHHQQAARLIEDNYPDDPTQVARLAYHWHEAQEFEKEAYYAALTGSITLDQGRYADAVPYVENALHLAADNPAALPYPATQLRVMLGDAYFGMGAYEQADAILVQSATDAAAEQLTACHAYALNLLGNIALARGNYMSAEAYLTSAIEIGKAYNHQSQAGKAMRSLGLVAETTGDYPRAKELFQDSLVVLNVVNDVIGIAGALANLAAIEQHEGNFARAKQLLQDSLSRFESVGFQWGIAYTLIILGKTLYQLEAYAESMTELERALQISRNINHSWGTGYCLSAMGQVHLKLQQPEQAKACLTEALAFSLQLGTAPLSLDILTSYSNLIDPKTAVSFLAMIKQHPQTESLTREIATETLANLQNYLPSDEYEQALAHGESRTLEDAGWTILANQ